jgi:hypothetical protein
MIAMIIKITCVFLGIIAYTAFIGIIFYFCCKAANEIDKDDENF